MLASLKVAQKIHPVSEPFGDFKSVIAVTQGGVAIQPTPFVLQRAGQIPMVKGAIGLDAAIQHTVDKAAIKIESLGVEGPGTFGLDARPCHGKTVRLVAQFFDAVSYTHL